MKKRFAPRQKMTRLCVSKNVENAKKFCEFSSVLSFFPGSFFVV